MSELTATLKTQINFKKNKLDHNRTESEANLKQIAIRKRLTAAEEAKKDKEQWDALAEGEYLEERHPDED